MGPSNPEHKRNLMITTVEGVPFTVEDLNEKQTEQLCAMLSGLDTPYAGPFISWMPEQASEPWPSELG